MMIALVLLGGAITGGGISEFTDVEFCRLRFVGNFVVRPIAGWVCLAGLACPPTERAISFFGIRGLGTIYYLAYAFQKPNFEKIDVVWSAATLTVLISIVLHGVTVTPMMRLIDRRQRRGIAAENSKELSEL